MHSLVISLTLCVLACSVALPVLADDRDSAPDRTTTANDILQLERRLLENYTGDKKKRKKKSSPKLDIPGDASVFSTSVPLSPINPGLLPDTLDTPSRDPDEQEEEENQNWILPPSPEFENEFEPFEPYGREFMEQLERNKEAERPRKSYREEFEEDDAPSGLPLDMNQWMQEKEASRPTLNGYGNYTPSDEELFFEEMLEEEEEDSEQADRNVFSDTEFSYRPVLETTTFLDEESADSGAPNSDFLRGEEEEEAYIGAMTEDLYPPDSMDDDSEESQVEYHVAYSDRFESESESEPDMTKPFWRTQEAIQAILYKENKDPASTESGIGSFASPDETATAENRYFQSASSIVNSIRNEATGEMNLSYAGDIQSGNMGMDSAAMGLNSSSDTGMDLPAAGSISGITGRSMEINPGLFGVSTRETFGGIPQWSTSFDNTSWGSSEPFGSSGRFGDPATPSPMNRKRFGLDARTVEPLLKN